MTSGQNAAVIMMNLVFKLTECQVTTNKHRQNQGCFSCVLSESIYKHRKKYTERETYSIDKETDSKGRKCHQPSPASVRWSASLGAVGTALYVIVTGICERHIYKTRFVSKTKKIN